MKHRRVEWGDGPPARPGLSLGRLSVSAPAQRYHWFWLGLCLAATVVAAQGVRLEMLAASRSDLSRYCDSLDQAFLHRIDQGFLNPQCYYCLFFQALVSRLY